jgi:TetR/AcrR family transcriptional regulator, transcriptional repressor for nem operon
MPRVSVREQIVDAALDQFHERGFNACAVKDITNAAKVPKGSFYNHFDSKESLALEVLRRYQAECALESLADTSVEPMVRLRTFFESLRQALERFGYSRGCLFGNFGTEMAEHSHMVREEVESSLARWSAAVAGPLREAQADGSLRAGGDPELLGRFIVDAWQGAVVRAKVARDRGPLDDFVTVTFGTLLA